MSVRARPRHRRPAPAGGTEGNERLTALTRTILLAGFTAEGVTLLALGRLLNILTVHLAVPWQVRRSG